MPITKYFELNDGVAIGDSILIKDDSGKVTLSDIEITSPKTLKKLITASENNFDSSTNGFVATNVQAAIEEAKSTAVGKVRFSAVCGYGGQAKGQHLEFFKGISCDTSPYVVPFIGHIKELTCSTQLGSTPVGTLNLEVSGVSKRVFTLTGHGNIFYETGLNIAISAGDYICVDCENSSTTVSQPVCVVYMQVA